MAETIAVRLMGGIRRGTAFEIRINGKAAAAYPGETLATVLLAEGHPIFRLTMGASEPRGLYCGMGICFDCLVTVNGQPNIRACVTPARSGDQLETPYPDG